MYQKRNITVAKAFANTVAKYRSKTCLIFEDTSWSFQDLENYSNRVGNFFLELGYKVCRYSLDGIINIIENIYS